MKLLTSPASPFARKVRIVLHETGQADEVTEIAAATDPFGDPVDVIHANPLGKIPALVRDDGPALYDSRVITRYLDARAGARLVIVNREPTDLDPYASLVLNTEIGALMDEVMQELETV